MTGRARIFLIVIAILAGTLLTIPAAEHVHFGRDSGRCGRLHDFEG